jgi:hypothetical protein
VRAAPERPDATPARSARAVRLERLCHPVHDEEGQPLAEHLEGALDAGYLRRMSWVEQAPDFLLVTVEQAGEAHLADVGLTHGEQQSRFGGSHWRHRHDRRPRAWP